MAEAILADQLTARIVERLSPAHLRLLKRKTQSIRDFRRRHPYGEPPQNSVVLGQGTHGIEQVRDVELKWSCSADGSDMKLKAKVHFGGTSTALHVCGQQCQILAELPSAILAGIRKAPMATLVDTDLLEGYGIHRIVGKVAYLKAPTAMHDICEAIEHVPANDNMKRSDFLRFLLDADIPCIDRSAFKFLSRTREYDTLKARLESILGEEWNVNSPPRFVATDLMTYLCLLYTSPSPRDATLSRMPSSA